MIPDIQTAQAAVVGLIEISVYATVIYLLLLLFRRIFGKKMSPALRYALWFLLLIRLTVPVTFQTGLHLIVLKEAVKTEQPFFMTVEPQQQQRETSPVPYQADETPEPAMQTEAPAAERPSGNTRKQVSVSVWQATFWIWIAGIAVMTARLVRIRILLQRRLKETASDPDSRLSREFRLLSEKMGIRRKIGLFCVRDITSPALTIGFGPEVLLPVSLTGQGQRQNRTFAMRHELMHFKRKDHLVMIWMGILRAVWWFNPVVWLMEKPLRMDMESACDAMAVEGLTEQGKLAYASLLLELGKESVL
ncbi:MAG: M56 family metallopeptidase [Clostridia bacterium]|nr:M56 family metallopeptidase [Clostridia bacterium]